MIDNKDRWLAQLLSNQTAWDTLNPKELSDVLTIAQAQGVFPLVYHSVLNAAILPSDLHQRVKRQLKSQVMHALMHQQTIQKIDTTLTSANIPVLWIKGAALALTEYPEFWQRYMGDVDFMVPFADRIKALELLIAAGYEYVPNRIYGKILPREQQADYMHHFSLYDKQLGNRAVELHFATGFGTHLKRNEVVNQWLWNNTQTVVTKVGTLQILRPATHFIYLCLHEILQHQQLVNHSPRLIALYDLWLLLQNHPFDDTLLLQVPQGFHWQNYIVEALKQVEDRFGLPDNIRDLLSAYQANTHTIPYLQHHIRRRRLSKLQFALQHATWDERLSLMRTLVFPHRAEIKQLYNLSDNAALWSWYLRRLFTHAMNTMRLLATIARNKFKR